MMRPSQRIRRGRRLRIEVVRGAVGEGADREDGVEEAVEEDGAVGEVSKGPGWWVFGESWVWSIAL